MPRRKPSELGSSLPEAPWPRWGSRCWGSLNVGLFAESRTRIPARRKTIDLKSRLPLLPTYGYAETPCIGTRAVTKNRSWENRNAGPAFEPFPRFNSRSIVLGLSLMQSCQANPFKEYRTAISARRLSNMGPELHQSATNFYGAEVPDPAKKV